MTEELLQSIRAALADEAPLEARAAGAVACRTILVALEAKPGEPLAIAGAPTTAASPIASAVAALRGLPPDQILDLLIAKLRSIVPETELPARKLAIPTVSLPKGLR